VVNLSDIAAMNVISKQIIVNLAVSNRFSVEAIDALYEGIGAACKNYNVDLAGGDTTSSYSGLVLSVTALGYAPNTEIVRRSGAKDKDILCVTGDLGAAYMGLQILERDKQEFLANPNMQPTLEPYEYIVGRQLKPKVRTDILSDLRDNNITPTSMIDISDGLASQIIHLSQASQLKFVIYEDKLPLDQRTMNAALDFKLDPLTCMLNGGEDYELLFPISPKDYEKVKTHPDIHFIGYADAETERNLLITKNENAIELKAQGFSHFTT
jgi:thiamine-monophosphate kinase